MAEKATNFDTLMHQICVGWGHCGSVLNEKFTHVTDHIPEPGCVSAKQFAEWVMLAEGEVSSDASYAHWLGRLEDAFVDHLGADRVEAGVLKFQKAYPDRSKG